MPSDPLASVVSVTTVLVVSDETSCNALPVPTTWSSNECTLNADLTLTSGGSLQIMGVRVTVPAGVTLTNDGGTITISESPFGLFRIRGTLTNTGGGTIDNSGYWDVYDMGAITNAVGSTIKTGNQLYLLQGTLSNAGLLTNTWSLEIGAPSTVTNTRTFLTNTGTFSNSGWITVHGGLINAGTLDNTDTINVWCGPGFTNTGTVTGNPLVIASCWVGGSGGLWSTAANWRSNSVPAADGIIILEGASGPTLDVSFKLTGTLTVRSTLVVGSGATLTNEGTIELDNMIQVEGTLLNNGTFDHNGTLINKGTALNNTSMNGAGSTGLVRNSGVFINAAGAYLRSGLAGLSGGVFRNAGDFDMNLLTNSNAGLVLNLADGTLKVNNPLANKSGGRIENDGKLTITHDLTFPARIDNASGATIVNRGHMATTAGDAALNNDGLVDHTGTFDNQGIILNNGLICGGGAITGNSVSGHQPQATCNTAPTAHPGGPYTGQEGVPIALSLSGSDPDIGQTLTFSWDLGDGTTGSGATPPTSHTYGDNPKSPATAYSITLIVDDGAGGADTVTTTAAVSNRAPTATFAPASSVDEGSKFTLTLTGVQDVAADLPTLERRFDCGSGAGTWGTAPIRICLAIDDATLPVGADIRDKDGGSSSYTASVTVLNVPPSLGPITLPPAPVLVGDVATISASFADPGIADTHTGFVRWNPGASLDPANPGVNETARSLTAGAALAPDVYQPTLLVRDDDGGEGSRLATSIVVVYDPDGGFLTGSGWFDSPAGALAASAAAGKGNFNLSAKYDGPGTPAGDASFSLSTAGFEFASSSLRWLVVTPGLARLEGEGTVGGVAGYGIRITAADGGARRPQGDGIRIRIWNLATGAPVYDNLPGMPPESVATAPVGGGNVTIHR